MKALRVVHLSDFHCDGSPELRTALSRLVDRAIDCGPDLVVVTGDLSADGRPAELDAVAAELERFGSTPRVVLPGNRDLVPSVGPPGEARPLPADSDLDFFLALEPALGFGFDDSPGLEESGVDSDPETRFSSRFGRLDARYSDSRIQLVGVNSTPRLRPAELERAARRLRRTPEGALRIFALHHGLLPVPGRKLRDGDLASRSGDLLALLVELKVDLVLHGHIHRAHAWLVSDGHHQTLVSSSGALVNDGRRDASFNEIIVDSGRLEIRRRSVATGEPTVLIQTMRAG
jgi:3',5'-cyclic AMP phosphodiesterase CpdA